MSYREVETAEEDEVRPDEFKLTRKQSDRMRQLAANRAAVNDVMVEAMNNCFVALSRLKVLEAEAWEDVLVGQERDWDWTIERTGKARLTARPVRKITPELR